MNASTDTSIFARAAVIDKTIRIERNTLYPIAFARRRSADPEQTSGPRPRKFSFSRIPVALTNAYRVFVTIAYIILLFTWAFINNLQLNYVHRMIVRVVFILLWVHAGSEIMFEAELKQDIKEAWCQCGVVALVALTILCILSVRPIRAAAYEVFFYAHFVLVLTFLVCAYFHDQYSHYTYWIYPFVRLIIFNHSYFGFRSGSTMDATAELLSEDFVRLHFHRPTHFHWTPGQTAYLIMPSTSNATSLAEHALGSSTPFWKEVVFFINVRGGFTARLKEAALKGNKVKVFVDGPYGPTPDLGSYDTSVLIAGGSGVSYTLPNLLHIIEQVRDGKSDCRRVVFIWSIRDANHIHWIDDTLIRALQLAPPSLSVSIRIHVTGVPVTTESLPRLSTGGDEKVGDDSNSEIVELENGKAMTKNKDILHAMEAVKIEEGRPNLTAMLREEVECATDRMSVSVCGSQAIARTVRHALRFPVSSPMNVLNGGPSVTLHLESFGYA
ncbi:ferric reductase NAD binding domain-containing protein [Melanogaster broomeanus]|nr:ferric reductase NAD binding domain-containing protein [Melanogaster broomeanus]